MFSLTVVILFISPQSSETRVWVWRVRCGGEEVEEREREVAEDGTSRVTLYGRRKTQSQRAAGRVQRLSQTLCV